MASPAQIEANRANALKSTGPRTAEGKEASRRNALKHGLAAVSLVLPDEEAAAVAARVEAWTPSLKPRDEYDARLVHEAALSSVQVDRCRAHEIALRTRAADRAATCWEEDREAAAEALGASLSRAPAVVAGKLRSTKQGCAWLIGRWEGLRGVLDAKGEWDEAQGRLALDLLGTPAELRNGPTLLDGDAEGRREVLDGQLARLRALKAGMDELDTRERAAAEVGLGLDPDRALRLARRYESACVRRFEWALKQLKQGARTAERPEVDPQERAAREVAREQAELARMSRRFAASASIERPRPAVMAAPAEPAKLSGESRRDRRARLARARRKA